jgi:steroid 5-alpha reductase family enzyme
MAWSQLLILFIVSLAVTVIGFKNYVWFLSIGYGLAIAACALTTGILYAGRLTPVAVFQIAVLVFYGLRLGIFLIAREAGNATYRKTLKEAAAKTAGPHIPAGVKFAMWIVVALLYVAQVSPVLYRLYNGSTDTVLPVIGACISLAGALIEAESDREKSAEKKIYPHKPAMHKLYRLVRCPNYFGEILVWVGVFVGGFTTYSLPQFIIALIAFISIFYVMVDGAKRLDKRQTTNYSSDPEAKHYMDTTPIMFPGIPVYHLYKGEKS